MYIKLTMVHYVPFMYCLPYYSTLNSVLVLILKQIGLFINHHRSINYKYCSCVCVYTWYMFDTNIHEPHVCIQMHMCYITHKLTLTPTPFLHIERVLYRVTNNKINRVLVMHLQVQSCLWNCSSFTKYSYIYKMWFI